MISFGADFLGTWNSPVAQSVGYGQMRKGRPGQRGKFVQVESRDLANRRERRRMDCLPAGTEGAFALSLAHVILNEKLRPASAVGTAVNRMVSRAVGLCARKNRKADRRSRGNDHPNRSRSCRERPAVALIGDAATAQTNGLFNATAVNALNVLLGSVGKPGGILFSAAWHRSRKGPSSPGLRSSRRRNRVLRLMLRRRILRDRNSESSCC